MSCGASVGARRRGARPMPNGYLGAFLGDGFACPLLAQIADELARHAARASSALFRCVQLWGFKYDSALRGINIHADVAAVNVNFWITRTTPIAILRAAVSSSGTCTGAARLGRSRNTRPMTRAKFAVFSPNATRARPPFPIAPIAPSSSIPTYSTRRIALILRPAFAIAASTSPCFTACATRPRPAAPRNDRGGTHVQASAQHRDAAQCALGARARWASAA